MSALALAAAALRHRWPRAALASATLAMALALLLLTAQLTQRPLRRGDAMLSRFERRYLVMYRGFSAWFDPAGVRAAAPRLRALGVDQVRFVALTQFFDETDPVPVVVCGIDAPLPPELAGMVHLVAGRLPPAGAPGLAVDEELARRRGVGVGGTLALYDRRVPVVGVFRREAAVVTADAYGSLAFVQALTERDERVNVALLRLRPGLAPARTAAAAEGVLPELRTLDFGRARRRLSAASGPLRMASRALAAAAAWLCALISMLTLLSTIHERMADFAVYRALGASRGFVFREVLSEGLLLAGAALPLGAAAATAVSLAVLSRVHPSFGGAPDAGDLARGAATVLAAALAGAVPPALRAVRADPDALLRQ